jgi:hypothetical protein
MDYSAACIHVYMEDLWGKEKAGGDAAPWPSKANFSQPADLQQLKVANF